ncbi:YchJ family protein [Glaciibacter sp. 2TAF33]|uniref:YchJ family protein n=1 Tax=Glaciibacter sp. 2TAF33 TaxID=3233015 RepID=UPI003F8F6E02
MPVSPPTRCPCLGGDTYDDCCGRFHRGDAEAPTAGLLMRSRFSAFAVGDVGYLLRTWHPLTRPKALDLDPGLRWYRLDILRSSQGGRGDSTGVVEFRAYYRDGGDAGVQHETSRFRREGRRWLYVGPA